MPPASPLDKHLRVEWRASAHDIAPDIWRAFFPGDIEGVFWYEALEASQLQDQFSFSYALVLRGDTPVALAPAFTMDLPVAIIAPPLIARLMKAGEHLWRGFAFQRTLFIGSPCADEGRVGLAPGVKLAEVASVLQAAAIARARAQNCAMLVWKDFASRDLPALRAMAAQAGLFEAVSFPGTRIETAAGGFEDYLTQLSGNQRHQLRKKLKRSRAAIDLAAEIISQPGAAVLAEIEPLFAQTYERSATKFERLTPVFWREITACTQARLIVLRARTDGKAAAFMLAFSLEGVAVNKFIGLDYAIGGDAFLYFRLWEEFVRWALASGHTILQSGQTGYRAKLDMGHELVPLANFSMHRNRLVHWIFAAVARRISWATIDEDLRNFVAARARKQGGAKNS